MSDNPIEMHQSIDNTIERLKKASETLERYAHDFLLPYEQRHDCDMTSALSENAISLLRNLHVFIDTRGILEHDYHLLNSIDLTTGRFETMIRAIEAIKKIRMN